MGSDRDDKSFDVLDLIINLLKEHEKTLDELIYRIEEALSEKVPRLAPPEEPLAKGLGVSAVLKRWTDFRQRCEDASPFGFVVGDNIFKVTAISDGILYIYREEIPTIEIRYKKEDGRMKIEGIEADRIGLIPKALKGKLDCGLEFDVRDVEVRQVEGESLRRIICAVDPGSAREWLATETGADPSSFIEGELKLQR